jgi:hypothetical protein
MFQLSHCNSNEVKLHYSLLRSQSSLPSVIYIHVSSTKSMRWTTWVRGGIIQTYTVQGKDRIKPCHMSVRISQGVDTLPSPQALNYLFERNELISFILPAENCNLDNLYNKPGYYIVPKYFFKIQKYHSHRHTVTKI